MSRFTTSQSYFTLPLGRFFSFGDVLMSLAAKARRADTALAGGVSRRLANQIRDRAPEGRWQDPCRSLWTSRDLGGIGISVLRASDDVVNKLLVCAGDCRNPCAAPPGLVEFGGPSTGALRHRLGLCRPSGPPRLKVHDSKSQKQSSQNAPSCLTRERGW